jgi:integrase
VSLRHPTVRDYLLLLLFTGLRRNEAATLLWCDIDFESRVLRIRHEIAKNHKEHRLPLSSFLEEMLRQRFEAKGTSQYVFPGQGGRHHIVDSGHVIEQVCLKTGIRFTLHDLRRTFLTTAEKLALPYIVLKKLANHSARSDTTFGYIVVDVERLREPMEKISKHLFSLMSGQKSNGMNGAEHPDAIAEKET